MNRLQSKIIIFLSAFLSRCVLGYLFLGGSDLFFSFQLTKELLEKGASFTAHMPYFPILPVFVWLGSVLSIKTSLPIAFCQKIIPIIFDTFIALLLYDFLIDRWEKFAFKSAMLYALSPISLIVTCLHCQWDSIPLFFLLFAFYVRDRYKDSYLKYSIVGSSFALSFLLKPFTIPFALFLAIPRKKIKQDLSVIWQWGMRIGIFWGALLAAIFLLFKTSGYAIADLFTPLYFFPLVSVIVLPSIFLIYLFIKLWDNFSDLFKVYLKNHAVIAMAGVATVIFFVFLFYLFKYNTIRQIDIILRHFNQGAQQFGLPFVYPFNQGALYLFFKNRFWIMLTIFGVAFYYYNEKINLFEIFVIVFALVLGFSGYLTHYLAWITPFLLLNRMYFISSLYHLVVTIFLLLFYAYPLSNPIMPYQNAASFIPLRGVKWLTPNIFFLNDKLYPVIRILGNYIIPITCLAIALYVINRSLKNKQVSMVFTRQAKFQLNRSLYIIFTICLSLLILAVYFLIDHNLLTTIYPSLLLKKLHAYHIVVAHGKRSPDYVIGSWYNIVSILFLVQLIWCYYSLKKVKM